MTGYSLLQFITYQINSNFFVTYDFYFAESQEYFILYSLNLPSLKQGKCRPPFLCAPLIQLCLLTTSSAAATYIQNVTTLTHQCVTVVGPEAKSAAIAFDCSPSSDLPEPIEFVCSEGSVLKDSPSTI